MTIETTPHRMRIEHNELSSCLEENCEGIDDCDEKLGDDDTDELGEDVYVLIFAYPMCSPIVLYSLFVLALEMFMIISVYVYLLSESGLLSTVEVGTIYPGLRVLQAVLLVVVPFLFGDFKDSLCFVGAEYNPRVLDSFPNATRRSWIFTCFLRFLVGFSLVVLSFLQIITVTSSVTDMILSVTAVEFIGEIDNHGFWLARNNFFTQSFRDKCIKVQHDITFPKAPGNKKVYLKRFVALLVVGALLSAYAVVTVKWNDIEHENNATNYFLEDAACTRIYVTFPENTLTLNTSQIYLNSSIRRLWTDHNEEEGIILSSFNGVYIINQVGRSVLWSKNIVSIYYDENAELDESWTPTDQAFGYFAYCYGRWQFYVVALQNSLRPNSSPCSGWLLRSPLTDEHFLEQVDASGWIFPTGTVEGLSFLCVSCSDPYDCMLHGDCIQENKTCSCKDGRLGTKCEAEVPNMLLAAAVIGEESWDYFDFDSNLILVGKEGGPVDRNHPRGIRKIYDRPVYIMDTSPEPLLNDKILCLYYIGTRWVFQYWKRSDYEALQDPVNTFWDRLFVAPEFYSEPTSSFSPVGLNWYRIGDSHSQGNNYKSPGYSFPVKLSFKAVGQGCSDEDGCGMYGNCRNGLCECRNCFGGHQCEFAPYEDYARDQFVTWFKFGNASVSEFDYYKRYWSKTNALYDCVAEYKKAQGKIRKYSRRLRPLDNGH